MKDNHPKEFIVTFETGDSSIAVEPQKVTQGGNTLTYTYDATGRRLKKQLDNQTPRHYMDGIENHGDTTIVHFAYGRLRRNNPSAPWTRDYFLKDYAHNIRVVMEAGVDGSSSSSSAPGGNVSTYIATMEESKAAKKSYILPTLMKPAPTDRLTIPMPTQ